MAVESGILAAFTSALPATVTPGRRLQEYLQLVRELSLQERPDEFLRTYGSRARFVVPFDAMLSMSRKGMTDGALRVTRSSRWSGPVDPWKNFDRLPRFSTGILRQLMDGGRPVKIDQLYIRDDDPAAEYFEGMNSLLVAPLFDQGEPRYMVLLMRAAPAAFTLDELSTLVLTANLIGRATSQAVLADELQHAHAALERELRKVGEIQRQLLPSKLPDIPGVRIATQYETSTQAGGDYYDFFEHANGTWGVLIADVSGHGAAAAVVMARMHAMMHATRGSCPKNTDSPAEVLRQLNSHLVVSTPASSFVTAFYGIIDPRRRTFRYANAGHNPPRLLRKASQKIEGLPLTNGFPLSIEPDLGVTENTVAYSAGDRLLLYTDGITEAFNARGEEFGTARLDEALERCQRTPESMIDCVKADLKGHCRDLPPADDRTLVAIAFD